VTASRFELARTIAELLMYANHAINFYLYCATGQKFRRLYRALYLYCAITCTALPGKSSTTCSVLSTCTVPFPYCFYLCSATGQNFYHHYLYCFYLSCATGQKSPTSTCTAPLGRSYTTCAVPSTCTAPLPVLLLLVLRHRAEVPSSAHLDGLLQPQDVLVAGRRMCWFPGM